MTALGIRKDLKSGEIEVGEIGNQIPGQMSMEDMTAQQPAVPVQEIDGKVVDTDTGEIVGQAPGGNVVDLRKSKRSIRRIRKMFEGLKEALQYVNGLKEESMQPIVTEIAGRPTAIRILKDTAGKIWQIRSM